MLKGSKSIRCDICQAIVAWEIPTGKYHHGIREVTIKERSNCKIIDIGFARHYRCESCVDNKERGNK